MTTPIDLPRAGLSFGPYNLLVGERLLTKEGVPVALGARALDILTVLISTPNEVVSKKDLMARVWPDVRVEEGSLRFHMNGLRKALGDGVDGARYITTLAGRGYCFVAPVSQATERREETPASPTHFPQANLPNRMGRMIGRDEDVAALSTELAASHCVTIVGAGGVGKTTVAVAVAHQLGESFKGATLFVDLGMLSKPELVATAVASMLGLSVGSDDARLILVAWLRDKRVLLILDTCEHLIEAVAELAASIVTAAPQVHILATSREALRIEGEHVYRLDALACPPEDEAVTAATAHASPAMQLFIERALGSGAYLEIGDAEAALVATICRRLDGVALAIELAARRVGSYGLQQTAELLDQHLALPGGGSRTAPARQRTLQATLDWSYELLSARERTVLRRLAIFVGHFTLDAALEVVASANLDRSAVLSAIDSLVAKSIVAARPIGAMMRYRLLDTTRAHALESLTEDSERTEIAQRHATYFRRWLEQFGAEWQTLSTGIERSPYFAALNNVRAALEWCFGAKGNVEIGVELAAAATPVFLAMSLLPECRRWSQRALLALDDRQRGAAAEMHLQAGLGISSMYTMGSGEQSHAALARSLELAETIGDRVEQFRLIGQLHSFYRRAGSFDRMLAVARRGETVAREMAEPTAILAAHSLLGLSHHLIGNQTEAHTHLEAALAPGLASNVLQARRFGFHAERPRCVLARTLWLLGYPEQAVQLARKTVDGFASVEPVTLPVALLWGGCAFRWCGDLTGARQCIDRLIAEAERHGLTPYHAIGCGLKGQMLIQQGEIEAGVELLQSSISTLSAERYELYATELNGSLAQGLAMMGRLDEALLTIDKAIAQLEQHGELFMPELERIRGEILEKRADERSAEEAFHRAIAIADQQSALSWRLRAAMSLSRQQLRRGRRKLARQPLAETYARFSEGFDTADLKAAKRLLAKAWAAPANNVSQRLTGVSRGTGVILGRDIKPREPNMDVQLRSKPETTSSRAEGPDMKLEVVVIPVSDVDRAKQFYASLGWRLDADFIVGDAFRGVQFTPPGSPASIHFGKGLTSAAPGTAQGLFLVVADIVAARAELVRRGATVSEVFHRAGPGQPAVDGPHPTRQSYSSFATLSDPDGNTWLLQEVTARLPGRVDGNVTAFASPADLAQALRRAAAAHGEHEKRTGGAYDVNWPDWYATYMVAEQAGTALPQ